MLHGTIRKKIVLIGVLQLLLVSGVLFALYYHQARESAREEYLARSRSLAQGLDPTGTRMENWKAGEVHGAVRGGAVARGGRRQDPRGALAKAAPW